MKNKLDKETFQKAQKLFQGFQKNEEEIKEDKLFRMNKGPITEIWFQVMKLWTVLNNPKSSNVSKTIAIGALLYLISPVDAIPDILPGIGLTDDVSIILYAISQLTNKKKLKE